MAPTQSNEPPENLGKWPGKIERLPWDHNEPKEEPSSPRDTPNGWRKPRHGKHSRQRR